MSDVLEQMKVKLSAPLAITLVSLISSNTASEV